ncbi:eukaryotic integral membrane protein-domain-containing protein [Cantharellus anzutake]|uniref:eukaryotic integral membrane protein-domain-containing protein n=1 Tax=Cantharellus anzutake TaxID=1750568 RepID=UPI001908369E|nr:eukaryotic integral membrane protein-domain-containing protein [Cantharellus anzutake]KAF8338281.1 eukaryotic integral membrane protein-domain-containing protein [Cantharellus anzutake]
MPFNTLCNLSGPSPVPLEPLPPPPCSLIHIGTRTSDLTLIPALVLWHPWTLVTSPFVELGLIELVISLLFLPISLRYFERLWGPLETTKFVLITVVISNIIAVFVNVLQHFLIGLKGIFCQWMSYRGLMALQAGILVALTQAIPEHQILLFGALGIRVKRLPMLYVTFSTIMCILGFQSPYILIQFGWLTSWIYLPETWGDRSETFAFVHWFPPILHKPISLISDLVYKICTRIGIVKAYGSDDYEPLPAGGNLSSLPGGARAEAERRRSGNGLKALDQRLASASAATTAPKTGATPPMGQAR